MTTKTLREFLSKNMKKQRKKLGLTQEVLAEKADLSLQMINDIEGCRTWVSDKSLIKIASVLETTPAELFLPPSDTRTPDFSTAFIELSELKIDLQNQITQMIDKRIATLKTHKI